MQYSDSDWDSDWDSDLCVDDDCMEECMKYYKHLLGGSTSFLLTLKLLTGKISTMWVFPSTSIDEIMKIIQEEKGIPPDQQKLVFNSEELLEGHTLSDYKIYADTTLYIFLKLRGC